MKIVKKTIGVAIGLVGLSAGLIFNPSAWAAVRSIDLEVNGTVETIARQEDGKILIGGNFRLVDGEVRNNIARLNADYTVDTNFVYGANNGVTAIAVSGTNIFACGTFTIIGGQSRTNLAKLNIADGSSDPNWNCGNDGGNPPIGGAYFALAADTNGLYVGGTFTNLGGQARTGIARVSLVNGSVDPTFTNTISDSGGAIDFKPWVDVLMLNGDSLYLAGCFDHIDGLSRVGFAKINLTSDAVDTAFASGGAGNNSLIGSMMVNGTDLYVGGWFTSIAGNPVVTGLAKLNMSSGAPDPVFNSSFGGVDNYILSMAISGTDLYIGGMFTGIGVVAQPSLAKLNKETGAVSAFSPNIDAQVNATIMAGTDLIIGGKFTAVNGMTTYALAQLNPDTGALVHDFNVRQVGKAYAFAEQPDGKIVIGGSFYFVNGAPRNCLARLNVDWSLDSTFTNGVGGRAGDMAYTLAISGSNLYVGGLFTNVAGQAHNNFAKFNTGSGSPDPLWTNDFSGFIYAMSVEGDNLFLGNGQNLVKIKTRDGAIDYTFTNSINNDGWIQSLIVKDSNLYVGGWFTNVDGQPRSSLAKINWVTGALDPAFTNGVAGGNTFIFINSSWVLKTYVGCMQLNGSDLYIGGNFSSVAGHGMTNLAKVSAIDGSMDPAWHNSGATGYVNGYNGIVGGDIYAMDLSGTNLYVGGGFTLIGGVAGSYLAKLNSVDGAVDTTFDNGGADDCLSAVFVQENNVYQSFRAGLSPKHASASEAVLFVGGDFTHMGSTLAIGCAILGDIDAPPEITTQPQSLSKLPGENAAFSLTAASGLTMYYRWQKDGTALTDGGRFSGAATTNLAITTLQADDAGGYRCVVSNLIGAVTSSVATLTVSIFPVTGDIDGDRLADLITVVGPDWYVWFSTSGYQVRCGPFDLGISGPPVTGDIDGDRLADLISVVGSKWYVWFSTSQYSTRCGPFDLGISGTPVTGDIDGDRLADLIVVVGSNWYVWFSTSQYQVRGGPYDLGISGTPATGDIDGDRLADLISVSATGGWYVWFSSSGYTQRIGPCNLGISGLPATGDIDGDRLADLISVVGANWYVWFSTSQYQVRCGPFTLSVP